MFIDITVCFKWKNQINLNFLSNSRGLISNNHISGFFPFFLLNFKSTIRFDYTTWISQSEWNPIASFIIFPLTCGLLKIGKFWGDSPAALSGFSFFLRRYARFLSASFRFKHSFSSINKFSSSLFRYNLLYSLFFSRFFSSFFFLQSAWYSLLVFLEKY